MRVRVNKHHKVYYGSRVYSEDDIVDAPEPVVNEWASAGRVRKLHVVRSKPVRPPDAIRPEQTQAVDGPEFGTAPGHPRAT